MKFLWSEDALNVKMDSMLNGLRVREQSLPNDSSAKRRKLLLQVRTCRKICQREIRQFPKFFAARDEAPVRWKKASEFLEKIILREKLWAAAYDGCHKIFKVRTEFVKRTVSNRTKESGVSQEVDKNDPSG